MKERLVSCGAEIGEPSLREHLERGGGSRLGSSGLGCATGGGITGELGVSFPVAESARPSLYGTTLSPQFAKALG